MDQNALILWNFLLLSYKNGLLEKNLQVLQSILDPRMDLSLLLASMEDNLSVADRAAIDVTVREKAFPLLKLFSDENFLQGVRLLLDIARPLLEQYIRDNGYDFTRVAGRMEVLTRLAASLKPMSVLMGPAIIDFLIAQKPSWKTRLVLRRMKKKIQKIKGDKIL